MLSRRAATSVSDEGVSISGADLHTFLLLLRFLSQLRQRRDGRPLISNNCKYMFPAYADIEAAEVGEVVAQFVPLLSANEVKGDFIERALMLALP